MLEIPEIDCPYDEKIRCDGPEHHCFICNVPENFDYKTIKERERELSRNKGSE